MNFLLQEVVVGGLFVVLVAHGYNNNKQSGGYHKVVLLHTQY